MCIRDRNREILHCIPDAHIVGPVPECQECQSTQCDADIKVAIVCLFSFTMYVFKKWHLREDPKPSAVRKNSPYVTLQNKTKGYINVNLRGKFNIMCTSEQVVASSSQGVKERSGSGQQQRISPEVRARPF